MSKMKEIFTRACDDIALNKYGKDFYELNKKEQDKVCKEAEQASIEHYTGLIDAERERRKYGSI
jgi:uncharacterized metal-binding protein